MVRAYFIRWVEPGLGNPGGTDTGVYVVHLLK